MAFYIDGCFCYMDVAFPLHCTKNLKVDFISDINVNKIQYKELSNQYKMNEVIRPLDVVDIYFKAVVLNNEQGNIVKVPYYFRTSP